MGVYVKKPVGCNVNDRAYVGWVSSWMVVIREGLSFSKTDWVSVLLMDNVKKSGETSNTAGSMIETTTGFEPQRCA